LPCATPQSSRIFSPTIISAINQFTNMQEMLVEKSMQQDDHLPYQIESLVEKNTITKQMLVDKHTKILIVAPTLDVFLGGQAVQTARLVEKLNEEPNIQINIQSIGPVFLPKLQKIKFLRTVVTEAKYLYDLFTKVRKYDIIHVCSAAHFSFLLVATPAVLIAKLFGKKTLLNYRSGQFRAHFKKWHRTLKPTLNLFDKIVVPSNYLVDVLGELGFEAESIHNFVNVDKFKFKKREKLRPVFFSNRLLEELYNIPCILRAFSLIQAKYPDAKLILASFGDQRESLENLAKELELKNVKFIGKVSQARMAELYGEVDIYLNSPNTDNMPGSLIECYATGVPIVTTNAGGIPYILEHEKTGLMVQIRDHEALAREAIRLLEDNDLALRLAENGREYVNEFTWRKVREKWLTAYADLLKAD
jgi:L-malate glycosyltransferase